MEFESLEALMGEIENDFYVVVETVAQKVLEIVLDNVQKIVYDPFKPNRYKRQHDTGVGGFYESWVYSPVSYDEYGNLFSTIFSYDAMKDEWGSLVSHPEMTYDPPNYVHARWEEIDPEFSDVFLAVAERMSPTDRRPIMDRAIAEGTDYDFSGGRGGEDWWTKPRNYWSPVLRQVFQTKLVTNIVDQILKSKNIKFIRQR